jgi:hypothetical protein
VLIVDGPVEAVLDHAHGDHVLVEAGHDLFGQRADAQFQRVTAVHDAPFDHLADGVVDLVLGHVGVVFEDHLVGRGIVAVE